MPIVYRAFGLVCNTATKLVWRVKRFGLAMLTFASTGLQRLRREDSFLALAGCFEDFLRPATFERTTALEPYLPEALRERETRVFVDPRTLAGIRTFWPFRSWPRVEMPFNLAISSTDTPCRLASDESVSPLRMVYEAC